jgi:hypothetical protein
MIAIYDTKMAKPQTIFPDLLIMHKLYNDAKFDEYACHCTETPEHCSCILDWCTQTLSEDGTRFCFDIQSNFWIALFKPPLPKPYRIDLIHHTADHLWITHFLLN